MDSPNWENIFTVKLQAARNYVCKVVIKQIIIDKGQCQAMQIMKIWKMSRKDNDDIII